MKLLCYFGIHSWTAWRQPRASKALGLNWQRRRCRRCGEHDERPLPTKPAPKLRVVERADDAAQASIRG